MASLPEVFSRKGDEGKVGEFKALPEGWYTAQIVKSEVKDTSKKDGKRLNLQFKIIGGEFDKRVVFEGLNIVNPNPQAVEISKRLMNSIYDAIGVEEIEDTQELHGIPMKVKLGIKPATAQWPESNKIVNVKGMDEVDEDGEEVDDNPFAD